MKARESRISNKYIIDVFMIREKIFLSEIHSTAASDALKYAAVIYRVG